MSKVSNNGWGSTAEERFVLTHKTALHMLNAAVEATPKIGPPQNIAIVDPAGILLAFIHMDNSYLGSVDIAIKKARTCVLFNGIRSDDLFQASQPGGPLWGIQETNGGLVTFGGGLTIRDSQGRLLGAIGVSGGSVEEDIKVAQAGLDALK